MRNYDIQNFICSNVIDKIKIPQCYKYNDQDGTFSLQSLENTPAKPIKLGAFECKYTNEAGEEVPFKDVQFLKSYEDYSEDDVTEIHLLIAQDDYKYWDKSKGIDIFRNNGIDICGIKMKTDVNELDIDMGQDIATINRKILSKCLVEQCPKLDKTTLDSCDVMKIDFDYSKNQLKMVRLNLRNNIEIQGVTYSKNFGMRIYYKYNDQGAYIDHIRTGGPIKTDTYNNDNDGINYYLDPHNYDVYYNPDGTIRNIKMGDGTSSGVRYNSVESVIEDIKKFIINDNESLIFEYTYSAENNFSKSFPLIVKLKIPLDIKTKNGLIRLQTWNEIKIDKNNDMYILFCDLDSGSYKEIPISEFLRICETCDYQL